MTATPLWAAPPSPVTFEPDVPLDNAVPSSDGTTFGAALWSALRDTSTALERATQAETAFIHGRGGLQEVVLQRAQADVMLAIATSAASRTAQSLGTIFNMQV